MATLTSINPYTHEVNATFETIDDQTLETYIQRAYTTYLTWKSTSFSQRKNLFLALAETIEADLENIAKLQTMEMGMLYVNSVSWLKSTVALIRWVAENGERILGPQPFD